MEFWRCEDAEKKGVLYHGVVGDELNGVESAGLDVGTGVAAWA